MQAGTPIRDGKGLVRVPWRGQGAFEEKKMFHGYLTGIISPLPTPHPTGMLAESITQVALFPFELDA